MSGVRAAHRGRCGTRGDVVIRPGGARCRRRTAGLGRLGIRGDVEARRRKHRAGLGREGTAAEQSPQRATPRREPRRCAPRHRTRVVFRRDRTSGRVLDRILQRRRQQRSPRRHLGAVRAEHHGGTRLPGGGEPFEDRARGPRTGGLGHEDQVVGAVVRCKEIDGVEGARTAHRIREVATADPDPVRDAGPGARQQHRDLLQPGARGRDDPHAPPRNDVRERERRPGDVGGAAVGPHHQQPERMRTLLEHTLRFERHVVAEQHHVQPAIESPPRLPGRVDAGGRDEGQVRVRDCVEGAVEGAGPPVSVLDRRGLPFQGASCVREGALGRRGIRGPDGDEEIVRSRRLAARGEQSGLAHDLQVRGRADHRHPVLDPRQRRKLRRELHQRHRIEVEAGPHLVDHHRAHFPFISSKRAWSG